MNPYITMYRTNGYQLSRANACVSNYPFSVILKSNYNKTKDRQIGRKKKRKNEKKKTTTKTQRKMGNNQKPLKKSVFIRLTFLVNSFRNGWNIAGKLILSKYYDKAAIIKNYVKLEIITLSSLMMMMFLLLLASFYFIMRLKDTRSFHWYASYLIIIINAQLSCVTDNLINDLKLFDMKNDGMHSADEVQFHLYVLFRKQTDASHKLGNPHINWQLII